MRIIVIGAQPLARALAEYLHLDHVSHGSEIRADEFVLDGDSLDLSRAQVLDIALRGRAAEVDVVLWLHAGDPHVIDHYGGRVVELDASGDPFEAALDALREAVLST